MGVEWRYHSKTAIEKDKVHSHDYNFTCHVEWSVTVGYLMLAIPLAYVYCFDSLRPGSWLSSVKDRCFIHSKTIWSMRKRERANAFDQIIINLITFAECCPLTLKASLSGSMPPMTKTTCFISSRSGFRVHLLFSMLSIFFSFPWARRAHPPRLFLHRHHHDRFYCCNSSYWLCRIIDNVQCR